MLGVQARHRDFRAGYEEPARNPRYGRVECVLEGLEVLTMHEKLAKCDVKNRATFAVNEGDLSPEAKGYQLVRPFRDPAAIEILQKIVSGLRANNYKVTEPKSVKAADGFVECILGQFVIYAVLLIDERDSGVIKCRLRTGQKRQSLFARLFAKRRTESLALYQQWKDLCSNIDEQLRQVVRAEQIVWLTKSESVDRIKRTHRV